MTSDQSAEIRKTKGWKILCATKELVASEITLSWEAQAEIINEALREARAKAWDEGWKKGAKDADFLRDVPSSDAIPESFPVNPYAQDKPE